jgi:hypothetical protein
LIVRGVIIETAPIVRVPVLIEQGGVFQSMRRIGAPFTSS